MRYMKITMAICFPMLDGETREDAEDRLVERIDPDGNTVMTWNESDVEVEDE